MNRLVKIISLACCIACSMPVMAQFNLKKAVGAATKAAQAVTLTDAQMTAYVKEYIDWMDAHNKVCEPDHPYTQRLDSLTQGLTSVEGIPLNFKVYWVVDVNAFACADGSVRVFAALMDIMSDEELLGVIGHEIGHVAHHDSKKAFKQSLLTSALKDGIGSPRPTAGRTHPPRSMRLPVPLTRRSRKRKPMITVMSFSRATVKIPGLWLCRSRS